MALLAGGGLVWLVQRGDLPEPGSSDDPVAVTRAFAERLTAGDTAGAFAYLHPTAATGAARNVIEYIDAVLPEGWGMQLRDCTSRSADTAECFVEVSGDPVAAALGIEGDLQQFRIVDGRLTVWGFPVVYKQVDAAVFAFVANRDPGGWATNCAPEAYTARCGTFVAQFTAAVVADLSE